jgi:hypothetical protein
MKSTWDIVWWSLSTEKRRRMEAQAVRVKKGTRASAIGAVGVVLVGLVAAGWWVERISSPSLVKNAKVIADGLPFEARRLPGNPILQHTLDERLVAEAQRYGYVNVNGPSLIRVPSWVENPLGRYYLYFAHHKGETIRLAYADRLEGPWSVYAPGVLELDESGFTTEEPEEAGPLRSLLDLWRVGTATELIALTRVGIAALEGRRTRKERGIAGSDETRPRIASPDVFVDHELREIRMYYHGLVERRLQMSRVAVSPDGLRFRARPELIAAPYLRVLKRDGVFYGLAMPGLLYRSEDGLTGFRVRPRPLFPANTRHAALWAEGDTLYVFYTRVGDTPERVLCSAVDIQAADWDEWTPGPPVEVLRPERPWEGGELPVEPSLRGESPLPVRELRDPAILVEGDRAYLAYAAAGEQAIAIAELVPVPEGRR